MLSWKVHLNSNLQYYCYTKYYIKKVDASSFSDYKNTLKIIYNAYKIHTKFLKPKVLKLLCWILQIKENNKAYLNDNSSSFDWTFDFWLDV